MANPPTREENPYGRTESDVRPPPATLLAQLRFLGPSFVLIGSIVGSGELILTTSYGATVGFSALWFLLVSCVSRVIFQAELGRYTISTGETALQAFDRVPGPRWQMSWLMWLWVAWQIPSLLTGGGILGGVGRTLSAAFGGNDRALAVVVALGTIAILLHGRYRLIEWISTFMVVSFSLITIVCAVLLQRTEYAIRPEQLADALRFAAPWRDAGEAALALATFAGTGVGGGELMAYTYWCLEKGYARYAGPPSDDPNWIARARGWIRVMHLDVTLCMVIFTLATVAFFALGAGILHRLGVEVTDENLIHALSGIYTGSLGPYLGRWAMVLFLIGSFFVLYSTVFSGLAGTARTFADALTVSGALKFRDFAARLKWIRLFTIWVPLIHATTYLLIAQPKTMITIGAVFSALMLPIIAGLTVWLRYRAIDRKLQPGLVADGLLWVCFVVQVVVAGAYLRYRLFSG